MEKPSVTVDAPLEKDELKVAPPIGEKRKHDSKAVSSRKRLKKTPFNVKSFAERHDKCEKTFICADSLYTPVDINIKYILDLSSIVYSQLCARDHRLPYFCSLFLFQYVSYCLAFIKLLKCDVQRGIRIPYMAELSEVFNSIEVPAPIADYIDTLGIWKTPNGIQIIPTLGQIFDRHGEQLPLQSITYANPFPYMLVVPNFWVNWDPRLIPLQVYPNDNEASQGNHLRYGVSDTLMTQYVSASSRLGKCGTLRTCGKLLEGTPSLVVSSMSMGRPDSYVPKAPCIIEDYYARRGVAYGFHDACVIEEWPSCNRSVLWPTCTGNVMSRRLHLAELARNALR